MRFYLVVLSLVLLQISDASALTPPLLEKKLLRIHESCLERLSRGKKRSYLRTVRLKLQNNKTFTIDKSCKVRKVVKSAGVGKGQGLAREISQNTADCVPGPIVGDINQDGRVDGQDLMLLSTSYNRKAGQGDARADLNGNGVIDFPDLLLLAQNFGRVQCPIATPTPTPTALPTVQPFKLFDAVWGYDGNRPHLMYASTINPAEKITGDHSITHNNGVPDEAASRAVGRQFCPHYKTMFLDDKPLGPMDIRYASEAAVAETIDKYAQIIRWIKEECPTMKVGVYRIIRDYWTVVELATIDNFIAQGPSHDMYQWALNSRPAVLQRHRELQNAVNFWQRLKPDIDVIFPSLYSFYDDLPGWQAYAAGNIALWQGFDLPIHPFIWPQYHESNAVLGGSDVGYIGAQYEFLKGQYNLGLVAGMTIWTWQPTTYPWLINNQPPRWYTLLNIFMNGLSPG